MSSMVLRALNLPPSDKGAAKVEATRDARTIKEAKKRMFKFGWLVELNRVWYAFVRIIAIL